jgi:hypothetical protein
MGDLEAFSLGGEKSFIRLSQPGRAAAKNQSNHECKSGEANVALDAVSASSGLEALRKVLLTPMHYGSRPSAIRHEEPNGTIIASYKSIYDHTESNIDLRPYFPASKRKICSRKMERSLDF